MHYSTNFSSHSIKKINIKEGLTLTSPQDIQLKCFLEIISWLLDDWNPYAKELLINKSDSNDDNIVLGLNEEGINASEISTESHEDSMF